MFFSEGIAFFNQSCDSQEEALRKLAGEFVAKGLVKDTFPQAVIDREKSYPTGLSINGIGVAIPHTDGIHIIEPQIGFMTLQKPVIFKDMGDISNEVEVSALFMLGLVKSEQQLDMLGKLVGLFQDEVLLKRVIACKDIDEFKDIMKKANIE